MKKLIKWFDLTLPFCIGLSGALVLYHFAWDPSFPLWLVLAPVIFYFAYCFIMWIVVTVILFVLDILYSECRIEINSPPMYWSPDQKRFFCPEYGWMDIGEDN